MISEVVAREIRKAMRIRRIRDLKDFYMMEDDDGNRMYIIVMIPGQGLGLRHRQ